jgi:hypothetical protein
LTASLPAYLLPHNPLDLGTASAFQPDLLRIGIEALLADPAISSILVCFPLAAESIDAIWMQMVVKATAGSEKPLVYTLHSEGVPLRETVNRPKMQHRTIIHRSPERAIRALARLNRFNKQRVAVADGGDDE